MLLYKISMQSLFCGRNIPYHGRNIVKEESVSLWHIHTRSVVSFLQVLLQEVKHAKAHESNSHTKLDEAQGAL
jgi:hypothetical protein